MEYGWILGIDTSNYKTSAALTDAAGNIIGDCRRFLPVKPGERGLRQQDALFQHINALPGILQELMSEARRRDPEGRVQAVSVSTRPRPRKGSYMPVFLAGELAASAAAETAGVPLYRFSHQEGHIAAAASGTGLDTGRPFVSFHFSGGTTEAVLVTPEKENEEDRFRIVGGTRDIAFGQVLDRVGVALGMDFPCGAEMDERLCQADAQNAAACGGTKNATSSSGSAAAGSPAAISAQIQLTGIRVSGGFCNLSGIETQASRYAEKVRGNEAEELELIRLLFRRICRCIADLTLSIAEKTGTERFLLAGGVTASRWIRRHLESELRKRAGKRPVPKLVFGDPALSSDNAVGIALLGGMQYAAEADQRITAE